VDKIDAFVQANQPQHLAVNSERPDVPADQQARSVCGKSTIGMTVQSLQLPVRLACSDCQWQLDQWLKKASDSPDYDDN
jgi:hypothetical protein